MKLFRRREVICPTVAGWLLLLGAVAGFLFLAIAGLYPFLSPNKPVAAKVLVVEGWLADDALPRVRQIFEEGDYRRMVVTGGDITFARELSPYSSYAELTYHRVLSAGFPSNQVQWVSSGPVLRDRTFCSAVALRHFLKREAGAVNLVTTGPHARRSRHLFRQALGDAYEVGIIPVEPDSFNQSNWWKCSDGFRTVIGEAVAWFYARWIFDPERVEYEFGN